MAAIGTDLNRAIDCLQRDQLVAIPTETVYGLAGNAFSETAVAQIFAAKNRPHFDPLIVHSHSIEGLAAVVEAIPPLAQRLLERFSPGPLTLLLPRHDALPSLVTAGQERVAVRIPHHSLTQQLLSKLPFPLAAPSANPFGYISPTRALHVAAQLGEQVCYILDGGPCEVGVESTIVGFEEGHPVVYRLGGITLEQLSAVIGEVAVKPQKSANPLTPGALASHYAPRKPLFFDSLANALEGFAPDQLGALAFTHPIAAIPLAQQQVLSPRGDLGEATQRLFHALRWLDQQPIRAIVAERFPDQGLGRAINDRLLRAGANTCKR